MKKIGILTINDYDNYGNRLQNYAAQEVLKSLGFYVETVRNETEYTASMKKKIGKVKSISWGGFFKKSYLKIYNRLIKYKLKEIQSKRIERFKKFTSEYILETNYTISKENIPANFSDCYDFFVTGSDQVWNPIFRHGSSIDFLTFAPKEKRIAYSPSFGVSQISEEYLYNYKLWLSEMKSLSVREEAGANIIKNLTGREATVLIDPTLMLSKNKWLSIAKQASNKPKQKYLLTYFLGEISAKKNNKIQEIAKQNDLIIINLADPKDPYTYIADPSEFVDFINSASVFCTDSFHGVVFSILLETPFIIFNREGNIPSMNSRIETLLSTFKLESRLEKNINNNREIFEIDYSHVGEILKNERGKVLKYLKNSLEIEKPIEVQQLL